MKFKYLFFIIFDSLLSYSQTIGKINSSSLSNDDINFVVGVTEAPLNYILQNRIENTQDNAYFINELDFIYYPNPVNDKLYLINKNNVTILEIKIYNEAGQLVLKTDLNGNFIDLTRLIRGTYLIVPVLKNSIPFKIIKN